MESGIKRSRCTHRNTLSRGGIVCNERVPGGQCICVHDERVCSSALSPETTRDGALKGWTGCEVLSSRVQDLH